MALWPSTVTLAGVSIPLDGILSALTVHHGREDISDEPTASTCELTLLDVTQEVVLAFEVGQSLQVKARDGTGPEAPRFTGHVTDATLDGDQLTIVAAGDLSRARLYPVGDVAWPVESWSARVTRIFAEAGLSSKLELHADPLFDPMLAARDPETAGPTTLGDYLAFLAGMVGTAVTDRMDGKILVQAIGARSLAAAVALDPADVAYVPAWRADLPGGNIVTVRYTADQSERVTITDAASVSVYGERAETIDTAFTSEADADYRARQRLARAAFSHWNMPEAPVLRGLPLSVGVPVLLDHLPASAPSSPWTPTVEGWTDEISGDDWTMTLALSDPLLSGLTLPWNAVPTSLAWNEVDPATDWTEALTLDDLEVL